MQIRVTSGLGNVKTATATIVAAAKKTAADMKPNLTLPQLSLDSCKRFLNES